MTLSSDIATTSDLESLEFRNLDPSIAAIPAGWKAGFLGAAAGWFLRRAAKRLGVDVRGVHDVSDTADGPALIVRDAAAFQRRIGNHRLIGLGESYMLGEWESPDLAAALTALAAAMTDIVPRPIQRLRKIHAARKPASQQGSIANARANVAHHYDLSNDLFASFLDETLTYSAALFDDKATVEGEVRGCTVSHVPPPQQRPTRRDLATAQRRKIDRLLDLADVGPGTRLLEIGTGWGELCLRAASRGALVRSVTLSSEQQCFARRRIEDAGLSDAVTIDLIDYREIDGQYDAVVSVEMIEAVGYQYWETYFQAIGGLLTLGGRAALQAITMPHHRMLAARDGYTWIDKYIFPGGQVPSVEAIESAAATAGLHVTQRCRFGAHYAETLRLWHEEFRSNGTIPPTASATPKMFQRMWEFYLAYCEAGFRSGQLDVQQILIEKQK